MNRKKLKFGFTGTSDALHGASDIIAHWWYIVFAALGSAIVSASVSFALEFSPLCEWENTNGFWLVLKLLIVNSWAALFFGFCLMIYGGKGTYTDLRNINTENNQLKVENQKIDKLKDRINSISEDSESLQDELYALHKKLVITWLKGSSRQLKMNTHNRVSIYYYVGNHFYLLARHSQNPKFAEIHRQKFSKNNGVISKAWEHRECIDVNACPEFPSDQEAYKNYMKKEYSYEIALTEKLTMKSCEYVALSITEADSHIGVIVFESDKSKCFTDEITANIRRYCEEYQGYMSDFIRGGIKYDKSAKVANLPNLHVDDDFLSIFTMKGDRE